jgi:hypothetical protein
MDLTPARQSVTQMSHLFKVRWVGDITGANEERLRVRAYHIGKRCNEPERVLLQAVPSQRNEEELVAQAKPCTGLGFIPMADVSGVDPIGDSDDTIWRVARIGSQILPSDEVAYSDKTGYVTAPQSLPRPSASVQYVGRNAVQGLDDWNANRRGRSHKPVSCTVDADDVGPMYREPLFDVMLGKLNDWDAVEAKRVCRFFVGGPPRGMRNNDVEAVRREPSSQEQRHPLLSSEFERPSRYHTTDTRTNVGT